MKDIDMFDYYLPRVTDEAAIRLCCGPEGGGMSLPTRVTTRLEIEDFKQANVDKHVYSHVALTGEVPQGKRVGNEYCRLMPRCFDDFDTRDGVHSSTKLQTMGPVLHRSIRRREVSDSQVLERLRITETLVNGLTLVVDIRSFPFANRVPTLATRAMCEENITVFC